MTNTKKERSYVKGHIRRNKKTGKTSWVKGHFRDTTKGEWFKELKRIEQPKTKEEFLENETNQILMKSMTDEDKDRIIELVFNNTSRQLARQVNLKCQEATDTWRAGDHETAGKLEKEMIYLGTAKIFRKINFPK